MNTKQVQIALGRLRAIRPALITGTGVVDVEVVDDFHRILDLATAAGVDIIAFKMPSSTKSSVPNSRAWYPRAVFLSKLEQAIAQLTSVESVDDTQVVRAGTLFTSIADSELRDRCSDLLTAKTHFDRAINQATQVLEDRIRRRVGQAGTGLTGTDLVNRTIRSDFAKTILVLSSEATSFTSATSTPCFREIL